MTVRDPRHRLIQVTLDGRIAAPRSPEAAHERQVAVHDLIADNHFRLITGPPGPYRLHLRPAPARLLFDLQAQDAQPLGSFHLGTVPFRRLVRDYLTVCDSYYEAIRSAAPGRIETLDMGRRGLHDEGADLLRERVAGHAEIDHPTARRLFTLLCALTSRG